VPRRRVTKSKRRTARTELTLQRMLDLTLGPDAVLPGAPSRSEPDDVLREVYFANDAYLLDVPTPESLPWAFWEFEPDVPDDLREGRPLLHDLTDGPSRDEEAAEEADRERRRRIWLASRPEFQYFFEPSSEGVGS
jgi:hypothetical protein